MSRVRSWCSQNVRIRFPKLVRLMLLGAIACSLAPTLADVSIAKSPAVLEGKLGGTLSSFDALFTRTSESRAADAISFVNSGGSTLIVQFTGGKTPTPDDHAYFILVRAPRPPELPALSPSDSDWSVEAAESVAATLLPSDVKLGEMSALDGQEIGATCSSELLAESLGGASEGSCHIGLLLSSPDTVSYITLTATDSAGVMADTSNPCEGLATWAENTSARLGATRSILAATSLQYEADPWAASRLWQYAAQFSALAAEQAADEAPLSVAWPSDLLTGAFNSYASALRQVATGLTARDQQEIAGAIDLMEGANADVEHARTLIEPPLTECGIAS
jgi:hypothetical protein